MKRIVAGLHAVREAIHVRPKSVVQIWLKASDLYSEHDQILALAKSCNIRVLRVSIEELNKKSQTHQGIIAELNGGPAWPSREVLESEKSSLIFALDHVTDPHNLGAIVRTSWGLKATGVIVSKSRSAGIGPASHKVASGGFEHVPILEASNMVSELKTLKDLGYWIFALTASTAEKRIPELLSQVEFAAKSVIILGSEDDGISIPTLRSADIFVAINQESGADSYNVSVSAGIAGYEFLRQDLLRGSNS